MTANGRADRRLEDGLELLAEPRFPDYLDDVLAVTSHKRQRPAWTFPGRWIPMVDLARRPAFAPALPWRAITFVLVLLLVAAIALITVGAPKRLPPPFGLAANGAIPYSLNGDLYLGDPNGPSKLLLSGPEQDSDPGFSRSGQLVFFLRAEAPGASIWTVRADGTHVTRVTPPIVDLGFVDFGGSDDTLYYTAPENGVRRLHVVGTDGSTPPRILAPDLEVDTVSFRPPDGREMLVRGETAAGIGLYVMNADGSNRQTLVAPDRTDLESHDFGDPRYSPDGKLVAYQHWDSTFDHMRMHVIGADRSNDHVIHFGDAVFEGWPVWLADSKQLVMQRAIPVPNEYLHFGYPFVVVNADGTGTAREIGPPVAGLHAELSPDGTKLLQFQDQGPTQIIIDIASGTYVSVPWQSNSYPSWQRLAP